MCIDFLGGSALLTVEALDIANVEFSGWQFDEACFDDLAFGQGVPALPVGALAGLAVLLALGSLALIVRSRSV
jgi:hypothetical protein